MQKEDRDFSGLAKFPSEMIRVGWLFELDRELPLSKAIRPRANKSKRSRVDKKVIGWRSWLLITGSFVAVCSKVVQLIEHLRKLFKP